MKRIKLTRENYALVDDEDFEYLNQWKWVSHSKKYALRYTYINKKMIAIYMHRLIMNCPKGMEIDHIDRNGLNNQKSNLRICTHQQNLKNYPKRINTTSIYKGVFWDKPFWVAAIRYKNKKLFIGYFKEERHAAMARDLWAKELHKEFASLNFKQNEVVK